MSGFKDFQEIIRVLESEELDSRVLGGFLEKVHVQTFQEPHFSQLEEVFKRLQSLGNPGALIGENFVGALAKAYDNLVTGNLSRPEVLSVNLQLLYVIDDLCEHPEGKAVCGKLFITRLLALISAKAGSLELKRASVDTLGALITRSADNQKYLVVHSSGCYKLFKVFLPTCGDFQLQASTAEILFRLTRKHRRLLDVVDDEAAKTAMAALHETEKPNLVSGIRNFVELINKSMGAARSVHSFRALDASLDDKFHEEVWIHIGSDHFSYNLSDMKIVDFSFLDIKEIKRESSSHLEIVICKEANNVDVFSRQRLQFRFSSGDLEAAYHCFQAKLATVNSRSAPSIVGKFSVGLHVPLPKASDFPMNEASNENGNENVSQLRSKLMAVLNEGRTRDASPVRLPGDSGDDAVKTETGWVQPRAEQRRGKVPAPASTVQNADPKNVVKSGQSGDKRGAGKDQLGGKRSPSSPSKTAAEKIDGACQPPVKQENASPVHDVAVEKNGTEMKKPARVAYVTPKAAPTIDIDQIESENIAAPRAKKKRPSRVQPLKKQKSPVTSPKASGRKKPQVTAEKIGSELPSKLVHSHDAPAAAGTGNIETAANKTRAGRKRQCNALNSPVTAEATKDNHVNSTGNARQKPVGNQDKSSEGSLSDVFDFPIETEMRGKRRKERRSLDSSVDFLKANGVENADRTNQPASKPDKQQKLSETAPPPSVKPRQYIDIAEDESVRKPEPSSLKRERLDSPERAAVWSHKVTSFFDEDSDGDMRATLGGRRSRQRNRYCSLDSPAKMPTRNQFEDSEKKVGDNEALDDEDNKIGFRSRRRNAQCDTSDNPALSDDDEVEEVPGDFIFLLANLLNKFKQKVQSRVKGKTTQILSSTSDAIRSEAVTLELQIHNDIEDYMQCCKSKLGDIELQLHDENVRFKEFCDGFEREFTQHCSRLDQMHSQMECAEDELKAISDKQRLAHRKLIVQMQKTSEERLKEAESKIVAIKKAAKRIEGLREAFYQLLDEDDS